MIALFFSLVFALVRVLRIRNSQGRHKESVEKSALRFIKTVIVTWCILFLVEIIVYATLIMNYPAGNPMP